MVQEEIAQSEIYTISLFGEDINFDILDVDVRAFTTLQKLKDPNTNNFEDINAFCEDIDNIMFYLVGNRYNELISKQRRSIKTYTHIAQAVKRCFEEISKDASNEHTETVAR